MKVSAYLGLDPGASGGIASIADGDTEVFKLDTTERDIAEVLGHFARTFYCFAYIERVNAMPKQGVSSTFKFGKNYGFLRGCLIALEIPFDEVAPGVWQRAMGCLSGGDKNVTKAKAQQLFPQIKLTHHTADALLIAEYCRRKQTGVLAPAP